MVGKVFLWEPTTPHARAYCKVDEVTWNGEETWVVATDLATGEVARNELTRFLEAISYPNEGEIRNAFNVLGQHVAANEGRTDGDQSAVSSE